ncbi:TPA: LysE family transporter [Escherichia coli]|nr:LysE family transporter [Escherichia coli]
MLMLFLTVAMVHIVALMSPGPDFFFVSQTAVSRSRKEAMMGVLGITCGVMVWAGIALLGLHLIIEKMAWLHTLIMVGGGLYLCWMGYQMLRGALKKEAVSAPAPQVELAKSGRGTTARWGIFALIIVETLAWFTVVASLFALPQMRRGYQRLAKWIDGFAGALFAGFGIHLIISR